MIDIGLVQESDAPALARMLRDLGWFAHMEEEPEEKTLARIAAYLEDTRKDPNHEILAARDSLAGCVGYAAVHFRPYLFLPGKECYLSELFVHESHRGKGVGKALLKEAEARARDRGCFRMMLITSRGRQSYKNGFYEKQDFLERKTVANFIRVLSE